MLNLNEIYLSSYSIKIKINRVWGLNKNNIEDFLLKFSTIPNKKIKFSGKGYKIIKRGLILNLHLNTSHNHWAFFFKSIVIKTQKQKFLFLNKNIAQIDKIIGVLLKIRPLNIFTKRGLRLNRQKFLKKIGKRSA